MKVVFNVAVDSAKQSSAKGKTTFDPYSGYFAADYFYQNKTNLDEALKWINAALAFDENGANLLHKANILAELKRYRKLSKSPKKPLFSSSRKIW